MSDGILDLIDGAIWEWETLSDDAMRWRPGGFDDEVGQPPRPSGLSAPWPARNPPLNVGDLITVHGFADIVPGGEFVVTAASADGTSATMESVRGHAPTAIWVDETTAFAEGIAAAFGVPLELVAETVEVTADAYGQPAAQATRKAVSSPRVPAYRDGRPRWQSPYGPANRRTARRHTR